MKAETVDEKHVKMLSFYHIDAAEAHNYGRKKNLLICIQRDSTLNTCLWIKMRVEKGLNRFWLYYFIETIINSLELKNLGISFCFVMDNKNIHHNQIIYQLFYNIRYQLIFGSLF